MQAPQKQTMNYESFLVQDDVEENCLLLGRCLAGVVLVRICYVVAPVSATAMLKTRKTTPDNIEERIIEIVLGLDHRRRS